MDKNVAGLLGTMAALASAAPAAAAPAVPHDMASVLSADSYAALLRPIPNAAALLRAAQVQTPQAAEEPAYDAPARVQTVQYPDQQAPVTDHHHHHHVTHHRRHHHVAPPPPPPAPVDHHHHHNSSVMLDHRFG